jgi:hypothetical protein
VFGWVTQPPPARASVATSAKNLSILARTRHLKNR